MKIFKRLGILLTCSILCASTLFNFSFAETKIGTVLPSPEEGWTRYEDTDININYVGEGWFRNRSYDTETINQKDAKIQFSFTGTSIRILSYCWWNRASHTILIDNNVVGNYDNNLTTSPNTLTFEKTNLENKTHFVEIIPNYTQPEFAIDAIDLPTGEKLLPYNNTTVTTGVVLNIEPDKTKIKTTEKVVANLTIDNIKEIAAEDIRVKYDAQKLKYDGATEVDGFKLVKNDEKAGELRFIVASKGNANIVSSKKTLLQLGFTGIAPGEAKVDVIKGRVSDGIEMEKDLTDEQCGEATILIEQGTMLDVNNSGAFTLLDLAIDARHLNKDPKSEELKKYNTDIVLDNAINDNDLSEIGRLMLENPDYKF